MSVREHDVIVIGGGPAGSCAANLLAQAGVDVLVVEREQFPRFHVGESLLPTELEILDRLGVDPDDVPFLRKEGAVFIDEATGRRTRFAFADGLPGTPDHAHQVERAVFDDRLLRAAERAGAEVRERVEVVEVDLSAPERVVIGAQTLGDPESGAPGERLRFAARYLIDASGQKALLARRGKSVSPYKSFGRAAVFRRYDQLAPEIVAELHERGDIILKIIDEGWVWIIPLVCGSLSVGMVKASGKVEAALFDEMVASSPLLERLTAGATPGPSRVIGNFSYRNTEPHGRRYACIGDAACFLDPIFSSGVALAFAGAERLADILAPALAEGREADPELMAPLAEHMAPAYEVFRRFIDRFYHSKMLDNVLLAPRSGDQIYRSGVISLLAADVWRDDNPFQNMLLRARRRSS